MAASASSVTGGVDSQRYGPETIKVLRKEFVLLEPAGTARKKKTLENKVAKKINVRHAVTARARNLATQNDKENKRTTAQPKAQRNSRSD